MYRLRAPGPCSGPTGARVTPRPAARQPDRPAARDLQPAHRHLVGDGRRPFCRCTWSPSSSFTPLQFGIIDGLYQGAAAFVRLAGGYLGDRRRRHKGVAAFGYGLSAVCKLALAAVGTTFGAISAIVMIDRSGKGLRTAPRDAMISLSSRQRGPRHVVRRAPRARHRRRAARPAGGVRPARAGAAGVRLAVPRLVLLRRRRPRRARPARARAGPQGGRLPRRPAGAAARGVRPAPRPPLPRPLHRRLRAQPGDGQRRLHLPLPPALARPRRRRSSRSCSPAPR